MFDTLYEDDYLLAVRKPVGMLVEGSHGDEQSLEDLAQAKFGPKTRACHRLDRETTGIVLFGKTARSHKELSHLFATRHIRKEYWTIVEGLWPKECSRIETQIAPLGGGKWANVETEGKPAVSTFRILKQNKDSSLLQVLPKTGRTHQIRLHCHYVGRPILGDTKYGNRDDSGHLALHARSLRFQHPETKQEIEIMSQAPSHWRSWLESLGFDDSNSG